MYSREDLIRTSGNPKGDVGRKMLERMNESHGDVTRWVLDQIDIPSDGLVLDIGCGGGKTLSRLSSIVTDGEVYGIDYSDVSVEESKAFNADAIDAGRIAVFQGEVSDLPFDSDMFDVVTAFETVYFWPDLEKDVKEVFRVVKPGGIFVLGNTDHADGKADLSEAISIVETRMILHSAEQFIAALTEAGFIEVNTALKDGTDWICASGKKPS